MTGYGALASPWWLPLLYVAVAGHITNVCITLFLHRGATHGGVRYHPVVEHFMRFWLWLTTGVVTREWVAVHRKHHAFSDREGDPHSPHEEGFWAIVLGGLFFYRKATKDLELLEKYGKGCPEDWVERNVYTPRSSWGILGMIPVNMYLFGAGMGLLVWTAMAIWLPVFGQVINGIGHALGYRNFETKDESHNIYPFGLWIVGEELHNNHHADPRSAKFQANWWEFDIGWMYIRTLAFFRLAEVVYARSVSAKEFAARYYDSAVAQPVRNGLDAAGSGLERAREDARARVARAGGDIERFRLEVQSRIESAAEELAHAAAEARDRLGRATAGARADAAAAIDRAAAAGRAELDQLHDRLSSAGTAARSELEQVNARARDALDGTRAALEEIAARAEGHDRLGPMRT